MQMQFVYIASARAWRRTVARYLAEYRSMR